MVAQHTVPCVLNIEGTLLIDGVTQIQKSGQTMHWCLGRKKYQENENFF